MSILHVDNGKMDAYATGRARLQELVTTIAEDGRNEATTRTQIIDQLLMSVLGWNPEDISTETHHAGEYVDYEIGKPATRLILEAKKEGVHFDLPAGVSNNRECSVSSLTIERATCSAFEQVIRYCQTRGVPVAVLCNGHQVVAFLASRQDGVPPLEGKAIIFQSLQDMLDDFQTFWKYLSKDGVAFSSLHSALVGRSFKKLPPAKLSHRLGTSVYPGFRTRTHLETDLKLLGELFLQDMRTDEKVSEEFLRECYCSAGALSQYAVVSREILRTRYVALSSHIGAAEPVYNKRGITSALGPDAIAATLASKPVILLGDVGVGKSIFIRHLIRIDAADVLNEAVILYVNFGQEPTFVDNLDEYVTDRILDQLQDDYGFELYSNELVRAIYNKEINRFAKSPAGALKATDSTEFARRELEMLESHTKKPTEHIKRFLEHVRGTAKNNVVIVLDNVDQRPIAFQESVFLMAQSFAKTWPAAVFLTLRPTTFYESKARGSLAAYQPRVFTITPARTDQVIMRRLTYARKQLIEEGRLESFPEGLSIDAPNLISYIDVLVEAFSQNRELKELFDNLSGGNLRVALDFLGTFIGSGYVSTARILEVAESGKLYTVPMHEVMRAITFGEYDYFNPSQSAIANIYDITSDDGREHFLIPQILAHVQRFGETAGHDGYVPMEEVYSFAQALGFPQDTVGQQLERAFGKRLLESKGEDVTAPCRVTTIGAYMYGKMASTFSYVDAMIVDTPIVDPSIRAQLTDAWSIKERTSRAELFLGYLNMQWIIAGWESSTFDWPASHERLAADIALAQLRATQAERRRSMNDGQ